MEAEIAICDPSTDAESETDALALCVVCDIRSFTAMQTRVHELVFESIKHPQGLGEAISTAYRDYVRVTQRLAHKALTEPLIKYANENRCSPEIVVKATGDGFMMALRIDLDEFGWLDGQVELMRKVVDSAYQLARQSELKPDDELPEFAKETRQFLLKNGDLLGFSWDDILGEQVRRRGDPNPKHLKNSRFRVAVGVSLGYATFLDPPRIESTKKVERSVIEGQVTTRGDVSGYGVNLAFRLCDHAGRGYEADDHGETPAVLLDRRVGRVLHRSHPAASDLYIVKPWREKLALKGVDEAWAYYLEPR